MRGLQLVEFWKIATGCNRFLFAPYGAVWVQSYDGRRSSRVDLNDPICELKRLIDFVQQPPAPVAGRDGRMGCEEFTTASQLPANRMEWASYASGVAIC